MKELWIAKILSILQLVQFSDESSFKGSCNRFVKENEEIGGGKDLLHLNLFIETDFKLDIEVMMKPDWDLLLEFYLHYQVFFLLLGIEIYWIFCCLQLFL
ncbi:hypothetical protein J1N35_036390 [Gossypium stocksii]|uniref:HAT C-terminal dimerisation domain-containing protein n=1 Tax=Gossypium stocksii TaxID=47602 RepID=A0A9D3UHY6_9ROSI|nr:hypothetical protein J1N35_036390 [Gossypium stocksii]